MSDNNNAEERFEEAVAEEGKAEESKTFTQEELDSIIQRRLERFKDYDAVKAELEALKEEKDSGSWRTEVANEVRGEVLRDVNKRLLEAEAISQATAANFLYPEDVVKYIDTESLEYTEDGYVNAESVKAQIEAVTKERPALVRSEKKTTARDVGLGTGGTAKPLNAEEAFVQALS